MAGRRWSEAEPEGMEAADPDLPDAAVEHISHMLTLGSRLVQSQNATAAARLTADRKFLASLS